MPLFITDIALNLGDIFFFFLDDIGVRTYCRGVIITTLFFSPTAPKTTFLTVLVFFASPALVGKRLLGVLAIKYVSKEGVSGSIPFKDLFVLFYRPVLLETLGVNFLGT